MPKVSIIVPIYKVEKYIKRFALSLFSQSYQDIEYVFVNDCTPDNSISILKSTIKEYPDLSNKIKIINHDINGGLGKARHTGLNNAEGEYVWFVDSDDWIEGNALKTIEDNLSKGTDIIMFNYIEEHDGYSIKRTSHSLTVQNILLHKVSPSLWKYVIKRDLLLSNNIYPIEGINYAEDFLMSARVILVAKTIAQYNEYIYHYNCENINSYMNNLSLRSFEDGAKSVISVYDFYKAYSKNQLYKNGLVYMLCRRFVDLHKKERDNKLLSDLSYRIKESKSILGMLLLLVPMFSDILLKIMKRVARTN